MYDENKVKLIKFLCAKITGRKTRQMNRSSLIFYFLASILKERKKKRKEKYEKFNRSQDMIPLQSISTI